MQIPKGMEMVYGAYNGDILLGSSKNLKELIDKFPDATIGTAFRKKGDMLEYIPSRLKEFVGDKKAIVGISGGVDSAVVAALCVKAIGKDKVIGVLMPYGNQDMSDAKTLVEQLGIRYEIAKIREAVDHISCSIKSTGRILTGNIKARVRMTILYAFSHIHMGYVIGTGNKSELLIGYLTKYGDGGVDIEPIGGLYKREVYELAKRLDIPQQIIDKPPSAELWEGQTDEDELGFTYDDIEAAFEKDKYVDPNIREKIFKMFMENQHKSNPPRVI
jgi:NAD+ synthase